MSKSSQSDNEKSTDHKLMMWAVAAGGIYVLLSWVFTEVFNKEVGF